MSMRICLFRPSKPGVVFADGKPSLKCFDIPVIIVRFPLVRPRPFFSRVAEAIRLVFGPQPEPWVPSSLLESGLNEETIRDARVLATVNMLTEKLSPALRGSLDSSVSAAAKLLTLPKGAEFTIAT